MGAKGKPQARQRPPIDGPVGRAMIAKNLDRDLKPPIRLSVKQRRIFDSILTRRAKGQWGEDDLYIASNLAKVIYRMEVEVRAIEREGSLTRDGKPNPRFAITNSLTSQMHRLRRTLGLHAGSEGGMQNMRRTFRKGAEIEREMLDGGVPEDKLRLIK